MRLGVVVRMDDRGLAHLTQEFARHMAPERVLVVDANDPRFSLRAITTLGLPGPEFYYASWVDGILHGPIDKFLDGLTHVYTAETGYDERFFDRCRYHDVVSICHVMPEFDRFTGAPDWKRPDVMWLPTSWRAEHIPGASVVPVPVPVAPRPRLRTKAETFVHVVGSRAKPDRNGTLSVYDAIAATPDVRWLLFDQLGTSRRLPDPISRCSNVEVRVGSVDDRWALYDEADVLVAPRRFGGLSLPVLEATACGVPVIMGLHDAMSSYGSWFVSSKKIDEFESPGGRIPLFDCSPIGIAAVVSEVARGVRPISPMSRACLGVADTNGWPRKSSAVRAEIEEVRV